MNNFYCDTIDIFALLIALLLIGLILIQIDNEKELMLDEKEKTSVLIENKENFNRAGNPVYTSVFFDNATGEYWEREISADVYYKQKNENKMEIENGTE